MGAFRWISIHNFLRVLGIKTNDRPLYRESFASERESLERKQPASGVGDPGPLLWPNVKQPFVVEVGIRKDWTEKAARKGSLKALAQFRPESFGNDPGRGRGQARYGGNNARWPSSINSESIGRIRVATPSPRGPFSLQFHSPDRSVIGSQLPMRKGSTPSEN